MSVNTAERIVNEIADKLREGVAEIEARTPVTKGHYGVYMGLFSQNTDDAGQARLLAQALKKAGANAYGVDAAYRICYG